MNLNAYIIEILIRNIYWCLEANYIGNNKNECLKCVNNFIPLINDKTCINPSNNNLSSKCLEAINIGNDSNVIYSCNKCNDSFLITNINNISNCFERNENLSYCEKGKITESGDIICIECVSFAHLKQLNQISICECDYDSFGINNLSCYKCDDEIKGNPGCLAEKGCEYIPENEKLICKKCKDDYFESTKGQCSYCSDKIEFCNKCHIDEKNQLICDKCFHNFIYNKYENNCQLNCKEYPEIAPGCIICDEKYKLKRKCQACKPGYFKTDSESCQYCRNEKYGGPGCDLCIKNKTDGKIICGECEGCNYFLNS